VNKSVEKRFFSSILASTLVALRQAFRQQWFWLIFAPFLIVVIFAPHLPADSETASYRLSLKIILGGGSAIFFIGIILAASASIPAEISSKTAQRIAIAPCGRISLLTGRILAFSILAALAAIIGFVSTCTLFKTTGSYSKYIKDDSRQFYSSAAVSRHSGNKKIASEKSGVLWVSENAGDITWNFNAKNLSGATKAELMIVPVVATTVDTSALVSIFSGKGGKLKSEEISLFDNRPSFVRQINIPPGTKSVNVRISRLPDSSPFGFDFNLDELGTEKNGVSLITGSRPFYLNLFAAWFVVWIKLSLFASTAVFASTFLSGPIAAAFSCLLYLLSNIINFLKEFAAALGTHEMHAHTHIQHVPHEPAFIEKAAKTAITLFTDYFPDASRFDTGEALIWGRAIPFGFIFHAFLYFLIYAATCWLASALILRRKEF